MPIKENAERQCEHRERQRQIKETLVLTLCQQYDAAAKAAGYKNWNTLCAVNNDLRLIIKNAVKKNRKEKK